MKILSLLFSVLITLRTFGAITDYYVTDAGAGSADGSSIANAMSYTTFTDYMVTGGSFTAAAGDRFNVIGAITSRTTTVDTWVNGGNSTSPVVVRGWKSSNATAYSGRTNGNGALITTDYPTIIYTTGRISVTGTFIILQALHVTSESSAKTVTLASDSVVLDSYIQNTGNSNPGGLTVATRGIALNCDVVLTGSGGSEAVNCTAVSTVVDSCRITVASTADGIDCASSAVIINNTIYGSGGIGISMQSTSGACYIRNNTVYGCLDNAIDIITGTTGLQKIVGNMITDNTGYAVDFNNAAVGGIVAYNRTRDNAAGLYNLGTDWVSATSFGDVTTDTGGSSTDYVNAGSLDFNLIALSPAVSVSLPLFSSMGALQRGQTNSSGQRSFVIP